MCHTTTIQIQNAWFILMMRQWTLPQQYVDCWAQIRDKTKFMITWSSCSKCVKLKMCNMRTNFLFTRLQTRKCIFPFGRLSNFLETMLWVRLRCSRVWRINHQKCVTFLPGTNLSYLALKIAHYSFIALKDDCSFFFPTLESAGRLLFVENEWSLLLSLGVVLHALMEALGRGKRVADGLL